MHRFPNDPNIKKQWLAVCGLSEQNDLIKLKICSAHFTISDFVEPNAKQMGHRLCLKPNAVPSILNVPVVSSVLLSDPLSQRASTSKCEIADSGESMRPKIILNLGYSYFFRSE